MAPTPTAVLTHSQTHALFDILVHHQVYAEIEGFKDPTTLDHYGRPFTKPAGTQTTSPLLQILINKTLLINPALTPLGPAFWQDRIRVLITGLADADLSEAYDKGALGTRKALATASSSITEYLARGVLGGHSPPPATAASSYYDTANPDDVLAAWDECTRGLIYGDLIDDIVAKIKATGSLQDHPPLIQATHEYLLLNIASFLHHVLIMSPDGQYIVRLLENTHRLIPYYMVKQTLRVGNAATMINGMVRLVLAKLSVTAMTNWIGLTSSSNDGMNLMQQIISTILSWDTSDFSKRASKLESSRDAPKKKVLKAIKDFVHASRDMHEAARNRSVHENMSIVAVILESADPPFDPHALTDTQHTVAMQYYSNCLAIRDREELTKVLCKSQPDVLTSTVREIVAAMDPIIRATHNAVDLSESITDSENFIADLIKTAKPKPKQKGGKKSRESSKERESTDSADLDGIPTVEDFVHLLRKHAPSLHKFLHQVTKNAPDLTNDYVNYTKTILAEFRNNPSAACNSQGGAGNMTGQLHSLFSALPPAKQASLKPLLDNHAADLSKLKDSSYTRLQHIVKSTSPASSPGGRGSTQGPGMYLERWTSLLDATVISPATARGPVRRGWQVADSSASLVAKDAEKIKHVQSSGHAKGALDDDRTAPVWEAMREGWVRACRAMEVLE